MGRLEKLVSVLFTLSILNHCSRGENFNFSCVEQLDGRDSNMYLDSGCIVANLTDKHLTDIDQINFPVEEHIILYRAEVDQLSIEFFNRMNAVKKLVVYEGNVSRVNLPVGLEELMLLRSNTNQLIINEDDDYSLTKMNSLGTSFTDVPKNIHRLANLTQLDFSGNNFEIVQLDWFNHMDNLEILGLNSNQLKQIIADKPIMLPSLRLLKVGDNGLTAVDARNWYFPNLVALDLWSNKLKYIVDLHRFTKLEELQLNNNELNCDWIPDVAEIIRYARYELSLLERTPCPDNENNRYLCCIGDRSDPAFKEYLRLKGGS